MTEEDEETPWFVRPLEDDEAEEDGGPADDVAAEIEAAEGRGAARLADVARRIGRLDAAVAAGAPVARLRAMEAADLMWRRGRAVRAERLALYEVDGGAPRGDDPKDYALAFAALRRLRAPLDAGSPEGVKAWLGWGEGATPPEALGRAMEAPDPAARDAALADWIALAGALA
ncbi:MAG: hypothetical protein AAGF90_23900, partial [Pseudomonadota bacterium]